MKSCIPLCSPLRRPCPTCSQLRQEFWARGNLQPSPGLLGGKRQTRFLHLARRDEMSVSCVHMGHCWAADWLRPPIHFHQSVCLFTFDNRVYLCCGVRPRAGSTTCLQVGRYIAGLFPFLLPFFPSHHFCWLSYGIARISYLNPISLGNKTCISIFESVHY